MNPFSRQRDLTRIRRIKATHRAGRCAVRACSRPLAGLGKFCSTHAKLEAKTGSAYHAVPLEKTEQYRAVHRAIWPLIDGRYRAFKPMLTELRGLLETLPTPPRQGSTRGMKPRELAKAILWHIVKQRNHRSTRSRGITPARLILVAAIAAECCPKPCSSPQYRRTQVARAIYKLLRTERRELFGRKFRVKISMQGKWTKQRLFELVEPIYRIWLQSNRDTIRSRPAGSPTTKEAQLSSETGLHVATTCYS